MLLHTRRQRSILIELGGHTRSGYTRVRFSCETSNFRFTRLSGADKNVPTWHSREAVSILKTWAADAIVEYVLSLYPYFHFFITVTDLLAIARTRGTTTGTRLFSGMRR